MKPEYEIIIDKPQRSFAIKEVIRKSRPLLSQAFHFHPEIEICLTEKSHGRRFVGNQISDYQENDLVMFGPNLPHGFTTDVFCRQIVIQMTTDFLGLDFILKPEVQPIKNLFSKARQGLAFKGKTNAKARQFITALLQKEGMDQLLCFLELLHFLSQSTEVETICSREYALDFDETQLGRIKIVYEHIIENFQKEVSIKEIADKLNISEAAFYKFIKIHTKKTYTQIVNELRISYASKLLMYSNKTIAQICFESGYNNISYFNRKFKELMQLSPGRFREQYN